MFFPSSVSGTNLQALMEQVKKPSSAAEIVVVISNRPGVLGLKRASMSGIQTRVSTQQRLSALYHLCQAATHTSALCVCASL